MFKGKTKNGVDIKATVNMPTGESRPTWAVVMDAARARIYETSGQGRDYRLISEIQNPDGRLHERDLGSDRPGRSFDRRIQSGHGQAGSPRHALSAQTPPHLHAVQQLVLKVKRKLREAIDQHRIGKLILVAEPKLLGLVREALPLRGARCQVEERGMDMARFSDRDITATLTRLP